MARCVVVPAPFHVSVLNDGRMNCLRFPACSTLESAAAIIAETDAFKAATDVRVKLEMVSHTTLHLRPDLPPESLPPPKLPEGLTSHQGRLGSYHASGWTVPCGTSPSVRINDHHSAIAIGCQAHFTALFFVITAGVSLFFRLHLLCVFFIRVTSCCCSLTPL